MANTHASLMNISILVREVTMKSWENLAIVSLRVLGIVSQSSTTRLVDRALIHCFTKFYYETSRSCSRTRSDLFYVCGDRIERALCGLVLSKRDATTQIA